MLTPSSPKVTSLSTLRHMDIRRLVSRIVDALGPEANPGQVEAIVAAALDEVEQSVPVPATASDGPDPVALQTITLGLSLWDCGSRLPQTVRARMYDKIRRMAAPLGSVIDAILVDAGVRVATRNLAVTPIALVADGLAYDELIGLAHLLDTAAEHVGVDALAGFSALVEHGMTEGDRRLLAALPTVLATTERLGGSVHCGTTEAGINGDAVLKTAEMIRETARLTADRDGIACTRFVASCNASTGRTVAPGGFHGPGEGEAVIHVRVAGLAPLLRTAHEVGPDADFGLLSHTFSQTACVLIQAGETIGRRCAERLSQHTGTRVETGRVDLDLTPMPGDSNSPTDLVRAMGFDDASAPGTTAAQALLYDAIQKGKLMAARATRNGKPLLPTARVIDSDLLPLPGDTSVETLAGLLLDAFSFGLLHNTPTTCRLVPVPGKEAGGLADFGAGLGHMPIQPVSLPPSSRFVRRGGHFPAGRR